MAKGKLKQPEGLAEAAKEGQISGRLVRKLTGATTLHARLRLHLHLHLRGYALGSPSCAAGSLGSPGCAADSLGCAAGSLCCVGADDGDALGPEAETAAAGADDGVALGPEAETAAMDHAHRWASPVEPHTQLQAPVHSLMKPNSSGKGRGGGGRGRREKGRERRQRRHGAATTNARTRRRQRRGRRRGGGEERSNNERWQSSTGRALIWIEPSLKAGDEDEDEQKPIYI